MRWRIAVDGLIAVALVGGTTANRLLTASATTGSTSQATYGVLTLEHTASRIPRRVKRWRIACDTGSGLIGAGLVGLVAGATAYGLLVFAFASLRSPVLRLIVALIFAAPAAMAGYALVHGVSREAVTSEIWRQIFCVIGGGFVGMSALLRLAADISAPAR